MPTKDPRTAASGVPSPAAGAEAFHALRIRAGLISLLVSLLVFALKMAAWWVTGSVAILSDALESTVNVLTAGFLVFSLRLASTPPDANHPYGHGKVEYFSAALEGGLILAAACAIFVTAGIALVRGTEPGRLDYGILILGAATAVNLALGLYLVRQGRRHHSMALEADGKHVLTDVVTSIAVLVGVFLVLVTGYAPLDPIVAILAGAHIAVSGFRVLRKAVAGLMNEADEATLARIAQALEGHDEPGAIHIHHLRAWTAGAEINVDFHLMVPNYWPVSRAHDLGHDLARRIEQAFPGKCDVIVHLDPCVPSACPVCAVDPCPIRAAPFRQRPRQDVVGLRGPAPS